MCSGPYAVVTMPGLCGETIHNEECMKCVKEGQGKYILFLFSRLLYDVRFVANWIKTIFETEFEARVCGVRTQCTGKPHKKPSGSLLFASSEPNKRTRNNLNRTRNNLNRTRNNMNWLEII